MSEQTLGFRDIERLSWLVISKLAKEIDEPLILVHTHPGGGQYDCLGLATQDQDVRIQLNRNGSSASGSAGLLEDIWGVARINPEDCAYWILSEFDFNVTDEPTLESRNIAQAAFAFSEHLKNPDSSIEWIWFDSVYDFGPRDNLLAGFGIPSEWQTLEGPIRDVDWRGWLWVVRVGERPHSIYNLKTGQVLFAGQGNFSIPIWDAISTLAIEREFGD